MADAIFIAVALAFFALCALYIHWCDRIIGPDVFETSAPQGVSEEPLREMAA